MRLYLWKEMALLGDVEILSREVCIILVMRGPSGQFVVTIMLILCSAQKGRRRCLGKVRRGEDGSVQAGRAQALLARGRLRRAAEVIFTS